jgi:DNA-binding NarL/FixJ family response regulator
MSLLWVIVGLTVVALLILNIFFYKRFSVERQRSRIEYVADKETRFRLNCIHYNLSAREIEVLRLILAGKTYKIIAKQLFIAERTVDKHVRNIYEKVGVNNKIVLIHKLYDSEATH